MKKRVFLLLLCALLLSGCVLAQHPTTEAPVTDGNALNVHFLDVG